MRLFFDSSCDKRYGKNGKSILSIIRFHKDVFLNPLMAKVSLLDPWSGAAVNRRCSVKKLFLKFRKIYRKTPVRFFFNKVADLKPPTLLKETLAQLFCEFCETFQNTFFYKTPQVAVSRFSVFRGYRKGTLASNGSEMGERLFLVVFFFVK